MRGTLTDSMPTRSGLCFNKIIRECNKINKARAKAEAKRAREQGRAEVKEAKARAVAKAKCKAKAKAKAKIAPEPLPRLNANIAELYEIQANMSREAWTVTTRIDTIMLKNWLDEASKY